VFSNVLLYSELCVNISVKVKVILLPSVFALILCPIFLYSEFLFYLKQASFYEGGLISNQENIFISWVHTTHGIWDTLISLSK